MPCSKLFYSGATHCPYCAAAILTVAGLPVYSRTLSGHGTWAEPMVMMRMYKVTTLKKLLAASAAMLALTAGNAFAAMDDESIAERIKPYGEVCVAGDECAEAAAAAAAPAGGEAVADAGSAGGSEGEALFKSKPCGACHSVDNQLVGPALKEVGAKYAGQDDAVAVLVTSITDGSSGKWGAIPMPPNAVSEDEATALAEWILSLN